MHAEALKTKKRHCALELLNTQPPSRIEVRAPLLPDCAPTTQFGIDGPAISNGRKEQNDESTLHNSFFFFSFQSQRVK